MLQISEEAATLVREVRGTDDGGEVLVRVAPATRGEPANLSLALVNEAQPGDEVGQSNGIGVCVAPELGRELEDKVLDVRATGSSRDFILRSA
jgi:Fe-S cluster assembly iron-binding protein IscA